MSLLWTTLLLFYLFLFCTNCYKLPFWEHSQLSTFNPESLEDPKRDLLADPKQRVDSEWGTQEQLEELSSRLLRVQRDIFLNNSKKAPDAVTASEESTPEALSDSTPHVTQNSITLQRMTPSHEHTPSIELQTESESTTLYSHKPHFSLSTKPSPHLTEDETTPLSHTDQTDSLELDTHKSKNSSEPLSTVNKSIVSTEGPTLQESTMIEQVLSTNSAHTQNTGNSTGNLIDDTTSYTPSKTSGSTLSEDTITPKNPLHGTTGLISEPISSLTTTKEVAHTSSFAEQVPPLNSLMKQCMLAIMILAVICTIFIICTIALAAKLSTLRSRNKNTQLGVSYTEMRCISSLLPENNQNNKASQKMKTFTSNVEDSDGDDNTTLNSFLEH
ncbi:P-selectin glycoprotein ligand 1 [Spea bombifrons]|uniref:P-selectin glycoprotein ligand 1 n=1 Tax=Spea bombifrons TaxID=233779 RepID=UPI00234B2B8A|nr:P-selectin glycoprotein ligand 1 [Spea bombifrons]